MQDDIVVLLEWFNANGINEIFDNFIDKNEEKPLSSIIKPTEDKSFSNVFGTLAKQQNGLKQNSLLFNNLDKIRDLADRANTIDEIIRVAEESEYYKEKRKIANNTIVFRGNLRPKILVVNDLPSENDDLNNDIFYGDAGELLKKMFGAIKIEEDEFSVVNGFFWRLAGGRNPIKDELQMCKPFVEKIISIIQPKMVVFTGNYSVSTFCEENQTIIKTRGKFFDYSNVYLYRNIKATGLYSPEFILKNVAKKQDAWRDLQAMEKVLGDIVISI
jgi:uracil-DNA glycosylase family 4